MGWELLPTYNDVVSGKKARRPGLDKLMADARRRKFDVALVWKLDRFGRSLVDCLNNMEELDRCGVRFIAVTQGLDTTRGTRRRSSCCTCWGRRPSSSDR